MRSCCESTSKLLVRNHGHDPHQSMMLRPTFTSQARIVWSSLVVRPPSCVTSHCNDLLSLGIHDNGTDSPALTTMVGLTGSHTCYLHVFDGRDGVNLGLDPAKLVQRWSVLQQL